MIRRIVELFTRDCLRENWLKTGFSSIFPENKLSFSFYQPEVRGVICFLFRLDPYSELGTQVEFYFKLTNTKNSIISADNYSFLVVA